MLSLYLAYLDEETDKELFGNIYESYKKQMVTFALTMVKNESDAEDVVSEVFLKIAQSYFDIVREIKNEIDLRNYLLKSTKNTILNRIRLSRKGNISLNTVSEYRLNNIEELSDQGFVDTVCNKMDYEQVMAAIEKLEEKYRDVLYFHFVMELSVPQTAKLLNQSLAATKKQVVRGKKMLLNLLNI